MKQQSLLCLLPGAPHVPPHRTSACFSSSLQSDFSYQVKACICNDGSTDQNCCERGWWYKSGGVDVPVETIVQANCNGIQNITTTSGCFFDGSAYSMKLACYCDGGKNDATSRDVSELRAVAQTSGAGAVAWRVLFLCSHVVKWLAGTATGRLQACPRSVDGDWVWGKYCASPPGW